MAVTEKGYLESDYLEDPYGAGQIEAAYGMQVNQIIRANQPIGMQAQQIIEAADAFGMQAHQTVNTTSPVGMQAQQIIADVLEVIGVQSQQRIGASANVGMQAQQIINASKTIGMQAHQTVNTDFPVGMQAQQILIATPGVVGMQAKQNGTHQWLREIYLEGGYMEGPYLAEGIRAFVGMQVNMINKVTDTIGMQAQQVINDDKTIRMQALMIVKKSRPIGMQVLQIQQKIIGMQALMVIYNTTQLRLMYVFPSRGTAALLGNNWTATSTASGDFSPNNLNTDVIEEVFRSGAGTASMVSLVCDSGVTQGVTLDTIAILGHNFTRSAIVQVQGSNVPDFSSVNTSFNMHTELENMYYIAPTFPNLSGQNRYWRFVIQDSTNSSGYIEIGTILFGNSHIFSVKESFVNPIVKGRTHFKDVLDTEGFTNVMNDRALKSYMKLRFENLDFRFQNYLILDEMIKYARTSLKILVIPTPAFPSRHALYGKLTKLPEEDHNSIEEEQEYIDLDLEWDESL